MLGSIASSGPRTDFQPTTLAERNSIVPLAFSGSPVLATGWSLLYFLFGGSFGSALLIFIGLKAIGR